LNAFETLGLSIMLYLSLYLTLAPIFGVLKKEEFGQLMYLAGGLGFLTGIISSVLSYEMHVSDLTSRKSVRNLGEMIFSWQTPIRSAKDSE
jgi:hypothetical protein